MIKNKLLLVALAAASIILPAGVQAQGLSISIGDRGYYNHGARYWDGDYEMVWQAGHWGPRHHWIHGHYVRGEHRRHGGWDRRHDDHHDDRGDHHDGDRH
jgi:hypothetical protein